MSQLSIEIQKDGETTEGPILETLIHLMSQCNLKYDEIKSEEDSSSSVIVTFKSQEEAIQAMDNLNGMDVMGSNVVVTVPEEINGEAEASHEEGSRPQHRETYDRRGGGRYNRRYTSPRYQNHMHDQSPGNYGYQQQQPQQPQQMDQYPCRLLIPSHMVKVILGKNGTTITSIQKKTNTKIDIHRDKGSGRGRQTDDTLTSIKGDPEAFSNAIKELLTVINAELESEENEDPMPLQLKLLAHDLLCGRIIGKGGNNLKSVRQESGIKKLIISNSIYDEGGQFGPNGMMVSLGERVITVEGTVDAISAAERIISQRLRDYMEKDLKNSTNNQQASNGYCGGGQTNNYYGSGGNASGSYPQMQMMYPASRNPYQQYPMGYAGYYPYPYTNTYPGVLGQGYPPFSGVMTSPPQALYGEEETCAILIPTKEVGAVIGRNGGYINKVKQYSNAQVRVVKGEEGGESRVEIRGTPDAQWRASLCVFGKIKETMKVPYSDAQLRTEFMVPGSCVGRIIGKKGQVVQDIQDKAQTDIEVPKDKQGGDDVPVYITGTFNGTQIALNRIRDIMQRARVKPMAGEEEQE